MYAAFHSDQPISENRADSAKQLYITGTNFVQIKCMKIIHKYLVGSDQARAYRHVLFKCSYWLQDTFPRRVYQTNESQPVSLQRCCIVWGTFQDSNHAEPCGGLGVGVSIEDRGVDVYARVSGSGCGSYMMSRGTEEARLWLVCLSRW